MHLIKSIGDAVKAAYKSTALKIAGAVLAGSMISGCFRDYFRGYWPPEAWQAQVSVGDGVEVRAQGNFDGNNSSMNADITHSSTNSTVESTGNTIDESQTVLDLDIRPSRNRNFSIRPVVAAASREVRTPAGQTESDLEATLLSADLRWTWGMDDANTLLVRPYNQCSTESTLLGDIRTTQTGLYVESRAGMFLPLFSYECNDIDLGSGSSVNVSELQLGTALWMQAGDNIMGAVGVYYTQADDGTEQTSRLVLPGSVEFGTNWGVIGLDGVYDGEALASFGVHGCIGDLNRNESVESLSRFVRSIQSLNYLERGNSETTAQNRSADLARKLDRNLSNARLIFFAGGRQQHNMAGEPEIKPYGYFGVPFNVRGRQHNIGVTIGPFLAYFPEDVVNCEGGVLYTGELNDSAYLFAAVQHHDYETREDSTRVHVGIMVPTR